MLPEIAELMNLDKNQQGALIYEVNANSPADKAGLVGSSKTAQIDGQDVKIGGDVITAADGITINDFEDLVAFLARYATVGQTINLTVLRDGKSLEIPVTLEARPTAGTNTAQSETPELSDGGWLGIQGTDVTPEIANAMSLKKGQTGALVVQVTSGGPADEAGIRGSYKPYEVNGEQILIGGDVITMIDRSKIDNTDTLINTLNGLKPGDRVKIALLRDGKPINVNVKLGEKPVD